MASSVRSAFRGSLLAAALGDALGARRSRSPGVLAYTDDTAESLVLARHIAENCGVDAERLAVELAEEWRKEPWRGYGPGPPRIFERILRGEGPLGLDKTLYPGGSYGNGCAMRIAPVGLFYHGSSLDEMREAVRKACSPTHSHPLGVEGALVEACAVAFAAREGHKPGELLEHLLSLNLSPEYAERLRKAGSLLSSEASLRDAARALGSSVEAHKSVPLAIYLYASSGSIEELLGKIPGIRGDRDTIAAMAAAIAGAAFGEEELPDKLLGKLENSGKLFSAADQLYYAWSRKCKRR